MTLRILACAVAPGDVAMPPQKAGRKARLPSLAVALARHAVGERALPEDTAVMFGTAYGDVTETEAFVENMVRQNEEMPKPRAFSASVHNAIASRVAMALGAKGACRTFVHGALSFLHALRSARGRDSALVGALDEVTPYVRRGREACGRPAEHEGGAVFLCGEGTPALAAVRFAGAAEVSLKPSDYQPFAGDFPCSPAVAAALAARIVAGEERPAALGLPTRPSSIALHVVSRFAERDRLVVERAP